MLKFLLINNSLVPFETYQTQNRRLIKHFTENCQFRLLAPPFRNEGKEVFSFGTSEVLSREARVHYRIDREDFWGPPDAEGKRILMYKYANRTWEKYLEDLRYTGPQQWEG